MTKSLDPERAAQLKQKLVSCAKEDGVDLQNPDRKWTLWARNGPSQLLFRGGASYPYEAYRLMGHYMDDDALILEVTDQGQYIVREFSCAVG
ncbi:MAG TPA: hypothetical protein VN428_23260 [Bryobacteraceae bacterium]|nr:hypothetical protein [Bryobacteraceae bacterium]